MALEDWLNDGVPLAAPSPANAWPWYRDNLPGRGEWRSPVWQSTRHDYAAGVRGCAGARPHRAAGQRAPLAALIPGAVLHEPAAGHIGMAAGSTAEPGFWRPLRDWLHSVG